MNPRRRKQTSWGAVIVVCIVAFVLFLLLPTWAKILVVILAVIASIEAICQFIFRFSLFKWIWEKIVYALK